MTKQKKVLPFVLAAALATSPFMTAVPKAYAFGEISVEADDDGVGETTGYTITVELDEDVDEGEYFYVRFDSDFEVDSLSKKDVSVDGEEPGSVSVSGNTIKIKSPDDFEEGDEVEIVIEDGITNPDSSGNYDVEVKTDNEGWDGILVKINKSGSNSGSSDDFEVYISGKYSGDETEVELGKIELDDDLVEGKKIYVTFPTKDMLPSSIDEADVLINDEEAEYVSISGKEVTIEIPEEVDGDDELTIEFTSDAGITLPETADDDYVFEVEYQGETYTSEEFEVKKGSGSSSSSSGGSAFSVTLSNTSPGARSSYSFTVDLGKSKLYSGNNVEIEFPSADMIPPILSASSITLNGDKVASATSYGGRVYLKVPSGFDADSKVKVVFTEDAWITNPKMPGSDYVLVARMADKTIKSEKFSITGTGTVTPTNPTIPGTVTPTPAPVPVNNSTATIGLTKSALNTPTGINVGIKGLGVPLVKNRDFLEVVMPVGFRVPTFINAAAVKVNGIQPSFVAARGLNLIIYPAQDIAAGVPVNVSIAESAGIATPAVKNVYSIGVYSSAEKYLLFARPVSIGGAPLPAVQQPQPNPAIPANATRVKMNVASFTLNGKTYPLAAAPYTLNGNTLVPAQFFKEALYLTTIWNNQTVQISSPQASIRFTVGSDQVKIGNTVKTLPVPVQLKNGMPMVPLKIVAETLKYKYGWDANTNSVYVYK